MAAQRTALERFRDQGFYTDGGYTAFEWIRPTNVVLTPGKQQATVSFKVCYNVDDIVTHDKNDAVVSGHQISPGLATYEVNNYDFPNPTTWKIAVESIEGRGCRR